MEPTTAQVIQNELCINGCLAEVASNDKDKPSRAPIVITPDDLARRISF
jgi:hypothetical protein